MDTMTAGSAHHQPLAIMDPGFRRDDELRSGGLLPPTPVIPAKAGIHNL